MKKLVFISTLFLIISFSNSFAQMNTASNTKRQVNQQARIGEGVRSGELTRKETKALEHEQKKIQIEKKMAKADGNVTPAEKRFLHREQKRASKHIARQKNDAQERR